MAGMPRIALHRIRKNDWGAHTYHLFFPIEKQERDVPQYFFSILIIVLVIGCERSQQEKLAEARYVEFQSRITQAELEAARLQNQSEVARAVHANAERAKAVELREAEEFRLERAKLEQVEREKQRQAAIEAERLRIEQEVERQREFKERLARLSEVWRKDAAERSQRIKAEKRETLAKVDFLMQRGREHMAQQAIPEALAAFKEAIKIEPTLPEPHFAVGRLILRNQLATMPEPLIDSDFSHEYCALWKTCIAELSEAIKLQPKHVLAHEELAAAYTLLASYEKFNLGNSYKFKRSPIYRKDRDEVLAEAEELRVRANLLRAQARATGK